MDNYLIYNQASSFPVKELWLAETFLTMFLQTCPKIVKLSFHDVLSFLQHFFYLIMSPNQQIYTNTKTKVQACSTNIQTLFFNLSNALVENQLSTWSLHLFIPHPNHLQCKFSITEKFNQPVNISMTRESIRRLPIFPLTSPHKSSKCSTCSQLLHTNQSKYHLCAH